MDKTSRDSVIAVQLYAFQRQDIDNDLPGLLGKLRAMGYEAIEGLPGHLVNYRASLDALKMRFAAGHVGTPDLDKPGKLIAYLAAMGATDVCCSGPIDWNKRDYDSYRATCDFLNTRGRILKDAGISLHYHNHEFEFAPVRGEANAMDVLLENFDSGVVDLCLDVGWVWRAGTDPCKFIEKHAEKITYLHLRDFAGARCAPLGAGEMDLVAVMAAVLKLPRLRWLVVEQDPGLPDPLLDMRIGREYLKKNFSR